MNDATVLCETWVRAPIAHVWAAITQGPRIMQWWNTDTHTDTWHIDGAHVGAAVRFGTTDHTMHATVTTAAAPHTFVMTWPPQGGPWDFAMVTQYALAEADGGTRVTLTETGFEALPDDKRAETVRDVHDGYQVVLGQLKALLEHEAAGG